MAETFRFVELLEDIEKLGWRMDVRGAQPVFINGMRAVSVDAAGDGFYNRYTGIVQFHRMLFPNYGK